MPEVDQPGLDQVCAELGVALDPGLRELALTHRSYAYEHGGLPTNERLEFLGDAILGKIVTEHLYLSHPNVSEGGLAKLRAAVVNAQALAGVARGLRLGDEIRLGRGEIGTGGADKASILADTTEAIIGAVYLAHGSDGASRLVHHLFDPLMARAAKLGAGLDWKTSLQELSASGGQGSPRYLVHTSGPDHDKRFEAYAQIGTLKYGPGLGRSKKQAEQEAASMAFAAMKKMTEKSENRGDLAEGPAGDIADD